MLQEIIFSQSSCIDQATTLSDKESHCKTFVNNRIFSLFGTNLAPWFLQSSQISNGKLEESVKVDGTPKYQIVPKTKSIATNNVLPNYQPKPDSLQQSQAASLSQNSSSIAKEVVRNYLSNGTQNGLNLTQTPEQRQKNQLLNSQIEAPRDLNGVVILSDDEDEMRPVSSQNVSNGNSQALQHAQMYQNYVQQNQVQYNQHRAPRHSGQNGMLNIFQNYLILN